MKLKRWYFVLISLALIASYFFIQNDYSLYILIAGVVLFLLMFWSWRREKARGRKMAETMMAAQGRSSGWK